MGNAGPTRRVLLARAVAVAGAGSAVVSVLAGARAQAAAAPRTDVEWLEQWLADEQLLAAVYEPVIRSELLSTRIEHAATTVLAQERAHAATLTLELQRLGGTASAAPAGTSATDKLLAARHVSERLAGLKTEDDCVKLLLAVEGAAQADYFKAIAELRSARLLRLGAQVLANHAQHATVITPLRRRGDIANAVPFAFVEGTS
jgi:hypothetical protein